MSAGEGVLAAPDDIANVLRRLRWARLAALWLTLSVIGGMAWLTWRDALDAAATRADRAARIVEEHALRVFDTNQMLLRRLLDLVGRKTDAELRAIGADLSARLGTMVADLPQVQGLFIIGADGRPVANSRVYPVAPDVDYSDREFYQVHRQGKGPAVFVTDQLRSRLTGEPFFDMSRRRIDDQDRFAGTVHVSLRPEFLMQFYARLGDAEPGLRVLLLREDGRLLATWPGVADGITVDPAHPLLAELRAGRKQGRFDGLSPLDDARRLGSFRRLDPYPLYAIASIEHGAVLADWGHRMLWIAVGCAAVGLGLARLAHVALQRTRREMHTAHELQRETDRRARAEASLAQSQRLETLGRLVGGVAHDFNNVLAVISSHAMLLRRVAAADARERSLAAVERAVATGSRLAQQLLALTRRRPSRHELVDLHERLPAVAELLRPVFGPGIALSVTVDAGTRTVEADVGELEVALINLGINARDAMPEGGRFELRARNATAADEPDFGDGFVVIEAADTGSGMSPETLAHAFEPFFTTKAPGKGTGLGLSQVQALCVACHGGARLRSTPGLGTEVRLFLAAAAPPPAAPLAQGCVLFVRPAGLGDEMLPSALRAAGCDVLPVDDLRMARALLAGRNPHVDFALIDADGLGARALEAWLRRLRRLRPGLPVLVATADPQALQGALDRAELVLRKPCGAGVVASAVDVARRASAAARSSDTPG